MDHEDESHGRRLSTAEHLEIGCRVASGATYAAVAAVVGRSTKAIQRELARTGGLAPWDRARSCQLSPDRGPV